MSVILLLLIITATATGATTDPDCKVPFQVDSHTFCLLNSTSLHQVARGHKQLQTLVQDACRQSKIDHLPNSHEKLLEAGEREIVRLLLSESAKELNRTSSTHLHSHHHHEQDHKHAIQIHYRGLEGSAVVLQSHSMLVSSVSGDPTIMSTVQAGVAVPLSHKPYTFSWPSIWATTSESTDAQVRSYCAEYAKDSVLQKPEGHDGLFVILQSRVLVTDLLHQVYRHASKDKNEIDSLEIVSDQASQLLSELMDWCMVTAVGQFVTEALYDVRENYVTNEVKKECGKNLLVKSIPINTNLIIQPPKAARSGGLSAAVRVAKSDSLVVIYEGETPRRVAQDICMHDDVRGALSLCEEEKEAALRVYCNMSSSSIHGCFSVKKTRFTPRAYLHVCDTPPSLVGSGNNQQASMLHRAVSMFCARDYVPDYYQDTCEKRVTLSLNKDYDRYQKIYPRYVGRYENAFWQDGIRTYPSTSTVASNVNQDVSDLGVRRQTQHIVVSRCTESVDWLARWLDELPTYVEARVFLYEKCNDEVTSRKMLETTLKDYHLKLSRHSVVSKSVPNIGFETHTYLTHILRLLSKDEDDGDMQDPNHVFFVQGDPFDHILSEQQRHNFYVYARELPFRQLTRNYASLSDLYMVEGPSRIYCRLFQSLFGAEEECPGSIGYYALSSFFASIESIRSRPIEFYRHAVNILENTTDDYSWKHGFEWKKWESMFMRPAPGSIWNRQFSSGKVMSVFLERMWHLIFEPHNVFASRHPGIDAILPAPETKKFYKTFDEWLVMTESLRKDLLQNI